MRADNPMAPGFRALADYRAKHFHFACRGEAGKRIAEITLNRPERKNPLTFDS